MNIRKLRNKLGAILCSSVMFGNLNVLNNVATAVIRYKDGNDTVDVTDDEIAAWREKFGNLDLNQMMIHLKSDAKSRVFSVSYDVVRDEVKLKYSFDPMSIGNESIASLSYFVYCMRKANVSTKDVGKESEMEGNKTLLNFARALCSFFGYIGEGNSAAFLIGFMDKKVNDGCFGKCFSDCFDAAKVEQPNNESLVYENSNPKVLTKEELKNEFGLSNHEMSSLIEKKQLKPVKKGGKTAYIVVGTIGGGFMLGTAAFAFIKLLGKKRGRNEFKANPKTMNSSKMNVIMKRRNKLQLNGMPHNRIRGVKTLSKLNGNLITSDRKNRFGYWGNDIKFAKTQYIKLK